MILYAAGLQVAPIAIKVLSSQAAKLATKCGLSARNGNLLSSTGAVLASTTAIGSNMFYTIMLAEAVPKGVARASFNMIDTAGSAIEDGTLNCTISPDSLVAASSLDVPEMSGYNNIKQFAAMGDLAVGTTKPSQQLVLQDQGSQANPPY